VFESHSWLREAQGIPKKPLVAECAHQFPKETSWNDDRNSRLAELYCKHGLEDTNGVAITIDYRCRPLPRFATVEISISSFDSG
jgi:hypothetical protein